ncbi:hypothetical protein O181_131203, partial [Austropuccinia psidii MF-1]|nr:hypothetical protein [Austropuccinia psidii MF-1]
MPQQYENKTKARIVGMCDAGLSLQKISELTGIPKTSIQDIVTPFNDHGTVQNLPRPGRKPILNEHNIQQLKVLHKEGIFSRIAVIKPHLQPQHFDKQLAFARAHVDWLLEEWRKVIWTDESSFELLKNPTPTCIWRTQ